MQPRAADRVWDGAPRSIQPSTSGRSSSKYFCMSPDRPECGVLYADHGDGRELARGRRGANVAGDQSWQLSCFHLERTDSTMPRNARIKLRELYKRKLHKHVSLSAVYELRRPVGWRYTTCRVGRSCVVGRCRGRVPPAARGATLFAPLYMFIAHVRVRRAASPGWARSSVERRLEAAPERNQTHASNRKPGTPVPSEPNATQTCRATPITLRE